MKNTDRLTQFSPPEGKNAQFIGIWFTNACNLNCSYCYIKNKSDHTISADKAMSLLGKELNKDGPLVDILFMGAETLTHFEDMKEIVKRVSEGRWNRDYHFTITTNGTLLNDEMKEWFALHKDRVTLGLSYDGDDEAQDINRSNSSCKIDKDFFKKNWPDQFWKMTISADTADETDKNIIALHEQNISFTANVAYEETVWTDEQIESYEKALYRLADYYIEHPEIKPCSMFRMMGDIPEEPEKIAQERYCGAGKSLCFFDMDGDVYPCHMLSPLVMPKEKALKGMYFAEDVDYEDPRCRECPVKNNCYTCLGTNYLFRGDIRLRDPLHCKLYQAQLKATIHMHVGRLNKKTQFTQKEKELIVILRKNIDAFKSGKVGMKTNNY